MHVLEMSICICTCLTLSQKHEEASRQRHALHTRRADIPECIVEVPEPGCSHTTESDHTSFHLKPNSQAHIRYVCVRWRIQLSQGSAGSTQPPIVLFCALHIAHTHNATRRCFASPHMNIQAHTSLMPLWHVCDCT